MKKNDSNLLQDFIFRAKQYLDLYFKKLVNSNEISLAQIYPINIEEYTASNIIIELSPTDYLGSLYESLLSKEIKKDLGQFYTRDNSLVSSMIHEVNLFQGKILEPSCGSGLFLVTIANQIISDMQTRNIPPQDIIQYICNNLYGNDIDPIALQITEINIIATLLPIIAEAYRNNNMIKVPKLKLTAHDFTQKNVFTEKFSLIIGNPPFVTMYGKRSRNMTEEKRAYYNTFNFVQNKTGNNKFNSSMFFVENSLDVLESGGHLLFILDIAFFETAYIDLRKYLIQNYYICSIKKGIQAFNGVASGQIVLNIMNNPCSNSKVQFVDYEKSEHAYSIDQQLWNNSETKFKMFIPLSSHAKSIDSKIRKYHRLDFYFPGKALRTCCALTGKTDEFIVSPNTKCEHTIFPYIEGSKGLKEKFGHLSAARHIKYDYQLQLDISEAFKKELELLGVKNKKRVTLGDKEAYLAPKIFLRQSASELITTYTEEPYAANNSIYILTNKKYGEEDKKLLKYVCGILNSDLITFYCLINKIIRIETGKTPQIKTSDLKDICICINTTYYNEIINLVELMLKNPTDIIAMQQLNTLVYKIYDITQDEQNYISKFLS